MRSIVMYIYYLSTQVVSRTVFYCILNTNKTVWNNFHPNTYNSINWLKNIWLFYWSVSTIGHKTSSTFLNSRISLFNPKNGIVR